MDTLALPFGAMGQPQLGTEFGLNYKESHLTLGFYNGFNGTSGQLNPALTNQQMGISKDFKAQLDQFIGDIGALTVAYYQGSIPLVDPSNTFTWLDHFNSERLYLTYFAIPGKLDLLAGAGIAGHEYVSTSSTTDGTFASRGGFIGGIYYLFPHLNAALRYDFNEYNTTQTNRAIANGGSIQLSAPYENNIFIASFNRSLSEIASNDIIAGLDNTFHVVWRFLF